MYRFFLSGLAGACLVLLAGCRQEPPEQAAKPKPHDPYSTTLRFDRRYIDSIYKGPPYSQGTLRQIAIDQQISWLQSARRSDSMMVREGSPDTFEVSMRYQPKVSLLPNGRFVIDTAWHRRTFPSRAAELADIRRKVDSLETLERTSPLPR